ncbi:MAG TPA: peptidylprolyl isomerase [Candidatus Thermoplasmatota archaeon]|nr:peptidylprolyl isomerase [Candidatus Thermoplasmatota archaeon]
MSPIDKPRKRVGNPEQKQPKSSRKWIYISVVLIIVIVAVAAFILLQNMSFPSKNNSASTVNPIIVIDTTMGTIKVELYKDKMPITTANFLRLVNISFYNGLVFHRVIHDFVIQSGGFYPNGTQKTSPYGNIPFETSDVTHVDGAISMASTGAKVGGAAQFFICVGAQPTLDGNYAAFGKVNDTASMDVVRAIAALDPSQTTTKYGNNQNWPVNDVIINSITIENQ